MPHANQNHNNQKLVGLLFFNLKDICCDHFNCQNQHLFELSYHCGLQQTLNKFHFRFFLHTSQLTEHYCSTVSAFYGLVVLLALSFNQKLTWFRYILGNFPFFTAKINGIGTSSTYLHIGNPCNLIIFIIEAILEYYINTFSINNSR